MNDLHHIPKCLSAAFLLAAFVWVAPVASQTAPQHTTTLQPTDVTPHRTRLILKDGSYQIVMSYRIVGDRGPLRQRGARRRRRRDSRLPRRPRRHPPLGEAAHAALTR